MPSTARRAHRREKTSEQIEQEFFRALLGSLAPQLAAPAIKDMSQLPHSAIDDANVYLRLRRAASPDRPIPEDLYMEARPFRRISNAINVGASRARYSGTAIQYDGATEEDELPEDDWEDPDEYEDEP